MLRQAQHERLPNSPTAVFRIKSLIRSVRRAQILGIPLLERQEIEFAKAGPVILSIEGPLFTTRFGGLTYELSKGDGTSIQGRSIIFRNGTSGFSKVTMDLGTVTNNLDKMKLSWERL